MADMKFMGILISLFIGVVFVGAMLTPISTNTQEMTSKSSITNYEVNLNTSASWNASQGQTVNSSYVYTVETDHIPDSWKVANCPIENFVLGNTTGGNYTADTDYVFTGSTGSWVLLNTTGWNGTANITFASYDFCGDGYITSSGGRTTATMILIFGAIALIAFMLWGVYFVLRKTGML